MFPPPHHINSKNSVCIQAPHARSGVRTTCMAYYFGEQDSWYAGIFSPVCPYTPWSPEYGVRVASQNGAHYRLLSLLLVLGTSARLKYALSLPIHTEFIR
ncbi:hypothetical protein L873DRAFT_356597 [Choiromyces venosus 120613-1]|uniref:Uncharacterized protein n=1 Tax=Choiromyces venosus 120613-1 TaxID=1336337 RepID=A0A3N4IYQ6_9PEZI|nr:hypothetical protein L873DRAFT_356597 [Choiromyces venosus 120613-1]